MSIRNTARISKISTASVIMGIVLSVIALATVVAVLFQNHRSDVDHHRHYECIEATDSLMNSSDYLTAEARMFVTTGRRIHAENYVREAYVDRNRDKAVETLSENTADEAAIDALKSSLAESTRLSDTELYAMQMVAVAKGMEHLPSVITDVKLSAEDAKLSAEEKEEAAEELVLGEEYQQSKDAIIMGVEKCTSKLIEGLVEGEDSVATSRTVLLACVSVMVAMFVALLVNTALVNRRLVVRPIHNYIRSIEEGQPLEAEGSYEMQQMAESYNVMYTVNHQRTEVLEHEAQTDALTGLLNRGAYDKILASGDKDIALILIDVDLFKNVNDTHGHGMGDTVLKRVATCILDQFRTTDYACRVGGDEFAVIMTKMRNVSRSIVERKLTAIADDLRQEINGIPATTLSVGVAFSDQMAEGESIYRAADSALYRAKDEGRDRVCFYGR